MQRSSNELSVDSSTPILSEENFDHTHDKGVRHKTVHRLFSPKSYRRRMPVPLRRLFAEPKRVLWSLLVVLLLSSLAIIIWLSLVLTVANRLRLPSPSNGVQQILQTWHAPTVTSKAYPTWLQDFTKDVSPIPCHAHNDYWHRIPLYEALAAGCISVEADIWSRSTPDGKPELFVGHNSRSLTQARTLKSLYLDPITDILHNQNDVATSTGQTANTTSWPVGVFDRSPNTTLVLLLDFKTAGEETWPTVMSQLEDLRNEQWLTHWTPSEGLVIRPLTIVGSGLAPFPLIQANTTYRDVFYDAPLDNLSSGLYTRNNSYYASVSLGKAVGHTIGRHLGESQQKTVTTQIKQADDLGLLSRYWSIPGWPVSWRNRLWEQLVSLGVGLLNVDDLVMAARWDWDMCVVGGIVVCS